ncbi:DOMON-like domain-containing protein [Sphingomonas canadensis]|uniref:DOMON-like domain-containing protein n=1 Tax=Sphingomonas canadensis TaxID=1219257 RepID=A0ABW3H9E7_9SPHN|nr:DOMON-like domain-containing protein [Sphingomonas canadensis]MCW3837774.1 DOMON-like domain-containing protein [Sphingomonas canadensis]
MSSFGLVPHPSTGPSAISEVTVVVTRTFGGIDLRYRVRGGIDRLVVPGASLPQRSDGLWKTTCFELFAKLHDEDGYQEFNFAPSSRWAAYRFDGYRSGMREAAMFYHQITPRSEPGLFELHVNVIAEEMADLAVWQAALSAVIEETDGTKSYWALHHPPGKPDFHHPDCFVIDLPPAS